MQPDPKTLLESALKLPESARADLAARLIDSLDPEFDEDVDEAWRVEAERRLDEHESGKRKTLSWPEARRRIMGQADEASAA